MQKNMQNNRNIVFVLIFNGQNKSLLHMNYSIIYEI